MYQMNVFACLHETIYGLCEKNEEDMVCRLLNGSSLLVLVLIYEIARLQTKCMILQEE